MNKTLTFVGGMACSTVLLLVGFVLGAIADQLYHEDSDCSPETCPECTERETMAEKEEADEADYARMVGRPGFTE